MATIVVFSLGATAHAAMIDVEFTGLNVSYDGTDISTAPGGDPLSAVVIKSGGVVTDTFVTGIGIDLVIPDALLIPVGGGSVTSSAGGFLGIDLPSGDFLDLDLAAAKITYVDLAMIKFTFTAGGASVAAQSLPSGLVMGDPVSISFSAPVSAVTDDGTYLTSFVAAGTGEVIGVFVPEPASVALLGLAGLMGVIRRRRC